MKRKQHTKELKARIALDAIKGQKGAMCPEGAISGLTAPPLGARAGILQHHTPRT